MAGTLFHSFVIIGIYHFLNYVVENENDPEVEVVSSFDVKLCLVMAK